MSKISTVLWDIGGVVLTNGWDHLQREAVFDRFGLSPEDRAEFEQHHAAVNDPWEKGTISFDEYLEQTLFFKPRSFTPAAFQEAIEDGSELLPDSAMPVLRELHAAGRISMGQLNNESRELNDMRLERFGLKQYLSTFFCSGYVRLRKPDPAIYRLAVEVLQRPASEILFIDDRDKNAAAAGALGMRAIVYKGSAALRAELEQLKLL